MPAARDRESVDVALDRAEMIMIVISPLLRGESLSARMTFVFGFHKATGVATGLTTITGLLNAVAAAVAGASRRP
ncbi:hypothetical protein [Actinophytocola xinjiangensis]|uniref:hypothetical protein n=1 Tax=Actinophytocola xinjiangensis TaxID=485602 RepID=UPI0012B8CC45|nr:hypothetical protein [Actinophytocola xinjiangensis]